MLYFPAHLCRIYSELRAKPVGQSASWERLPKESRFHVILRASIAEIFFTTGLSSYCWIRIVSLYSYTHVVCAFRFFSQFHELLSFVLAAGFDRPGLRALWLSYGACTCIWRELHFGIWGLAKTASTWGLETFGLPPSLVNPLLVFCVALTGTGETLWLLYCFSENFFSPARWLFRFYGSSFIGSSFGAVAFSSFYARWRERLKKE